MANRPAIGVIYSNHVLQAPDGTPISRIGADRSEWYLERGLAEVVKPFPFTFSRRFPFLARRQAPLTIRLKFEPKGRGHEGDPYYMAEKENRCVVCGSCDDINKHHVVPRCYRKYMPEDYKDRSSHDVVILCVVCHTRYEVEANKRKRKIALDLGFDVSSRKMKDVAPDKVREVQAQKSAAALLRHGDTIPADRVEVLRGLVRQFLGEEPTPEELDRFAFGPRYYLPNHMGEETSKYVLSRVDLHEFVLGWRRHFIEVMNPQHLPSGWDAERSLSRAS